MIETIIQQYENELKALKLIRSGKYEKSPEYYDYSGTIEQQERNIFQLRAALTSHTGGSKSAKQFIFDTYGDQVESPIPFKDVVFLMEAYAAQFQHIPERGEEGKPTKYRDINSNVIHIGQVFDIGQTVNGQSQFYIAELDKNGMVTDIRYAHDGSQYEYSLDGFMNDCEEAFAIITSAPTPAPSQDLPAQGSKETKFTMGDFRYGLMLGGHIPPYNQSEADAKLALEVYEKWGLKVGDKTQYGTIIAINMVSVTYDNAPNLPFSLESYTAFPQVIDKTPTPHGLKDLREISDKDKIELSAILGWTSDNIEARKAAATEFCIQVEANTSSWCQWYNWVTGIDFLRSRGYNIPNSYPVAAHLKIDWKEVEDGIRKIAYQKMCYSGEIHEIIFCLKQHFSTVGESESVDWDTAITECLEHADGTPHALGMFDKDAQAYLKAHYILTKKQSRP